MWGGTPDNEVRVVSEHALRNRYLVLAVPGLNGAHASEQYMRALLPGLDFDFDCTGCPQFADSDMGGSICAAHLVGRLHLTRHENIILHGTSQGTATILRVMCGDGKSTPSRDARIKLVILEAVVVSASSTIWHFVSNMGRNPDDPEYRRMEERADPSKTGLGALGARFTMGVWKHVMPRLKYIPLATWVVPRVVQRLGLPNLTLTSTQPIDVLQGFPFNLPVMIGHSTDDTESPVQHSRALYNALRANGNTRVCIYERPGMNHMGVFDDPQLVSWRNSTMTPSVLALALVRSKVHNGAHDASCDAMRMAASLWSMSDYERCEPELLAVQRFEWWQRSTKWMLLAWAALFVVLSITLALVL